MKGNLWFGEQFRFYNFLGKKQADDIVSKSNIHTHFKQYRKSKTYSPTYVYSRRELFQSYVVFLTSKNIVEANIGYIYILLQLIFCSSKLNQVFSQQDPEEANAHPKPKSSSENF